MKRYELPQNTLAALDPGIREMVKWLVGHGFETTDSGDGVSKPELARVFDWPHVVIVLEPAELVSESQRCWSLLPESMRAAGWIVEASYSPADGIASALVHCPPNT